LIASKEYPAVSRLYDFSVAVEARRFNQFIFPDEHLSDASGKADIWIVVPAQILFAVSAFRCLFPVRYEHNVVFHDSALSSVFVTRLVATFSEIAYIFFFSHVLRLLNIYRVRWIDILSWLMVAQVVISRCFVWTAILTEQFEFYFYEELGWAFIFAANTVASAYLYLTLGGLGGKNVVLLLNLLFGVVYLPWQTLHLARLRAEAIRNQSQSKPNSLPISKRLGMGLHRTVRIKNIRTDAASWGGPIGLTWLTAYWATLIPIWINYVAIILCRH
jgi:hypothetical protein